MSKFKTAAVIFIFVAIGIASAVATFYQFRFGDGCFILARFGIPCPTCGMTRANRCLFLGRISEAFGYHPLFWVPYIMVALGLGCIPDTRWRKRFVYGIAALLIAFVVVWGIRIAFFDWRG